MWRVIAALFVLSVAGQTEWRESTPVLALPIWADPAPREIPAGPILDTLPSGDWTMPETPFSDAILAAILSSTLPDA